MATERKADTAVERVTAIEGARAGVTAVKHTVAAKLAAAANPTSADDPVAAAVHPTTAELAVSLSMIY